VLPVMRFNKDSFESFISAPPHTFPDSDEVHALNTVRILVRLHVFVLRLGSGCHFALSLIYTDGKQRFSRSHDDGEWFR
jgi:hypothetical protein